MLEQGRFVVGDAVWEKVAPLLPGKASDPGATARDNRLFLEAVLWRGRTGAPWRDLPGEFGGWNSVFQRVRRWGKGGVFERIFACLSDQPDFEDAFIDGTIVTAHQKVRGAATRVRVRREGVPMCARPGEGGGRKGGPQTAALGRARGALTTQSAAPADPPGLLVRFTRLPPPRHDSVKRKGILQTPIEMS